MQDSFLDMREKQTAKTYLKKDYSEEDKKFKAEKKNFIDGISFINSKSELKYEYSEKEKCVEGMQKNIVECIDKNTVSLNTNNIASVTPSLNKVVITTPPEDILMAKNDDIFGENDIFSAEKQSKNNAVVEDDFFSETPLASNIATKTKKSEKTTEDFVLPTTSKKTPAKTEPEPTVTTTTATTTMAAVSIPEKTETKSYLESNSMSAPEGFDEARFRGIYDVANEMLDVLRIEEDAIFLVKNIADYSADIDFENKDDPSALSDKLQEVQAKRNALYTVRAKIMPAIIAAEKAEEWLLSAGMDCSHAKSADKRESQIRCAAPEFFKHLAKIKTIEARIKVIHEHLNGQYECVSRIITVWQEKNKISEISRSEVPFDHAVPIKEHKQPEIKEEVKVVEKKKTEVVVPSKNDSEDFSIKTKKKDVQLGSDLKDFDF